MVETEVAIQAIAVDGDAIVLEVTGYFPRRCPGLRPRLRGRELVRELALERTMEMEP
jgi:hypothetical protein